MKSEDVVWIAGVVGLMVAGFIIGKFEADNRNEKNAVKRGVGEYYLDSNNDRQFRWKPPLVVTQTVERVLMGGLVVLPQGDVPEFLQDGYPFTNKLK